MSPDVVYYKQLPDIKAVSIYHDHVNFSGDKPKGGRTIAVLKFDDGAYIGVAECSKKDNYDRKLGRRIALGRAMAIRTQQQQGQLRQHYLDTLKFVKVRTPDGEETQTTRHTKDIPSFMVGGKK